MATRTYGTLELREGYWRLRCEPHVALWAKRIFNRIHKGSHGELKLTHSPSICRDLEWFTVRFPLDVKHPRELSEGAAAHREHIATLDEITGGRTKPRAFGLAKPLREYQQVAAEVYLRQGYLLLGDDVGLGKTATAIGSFCDPRCLPAAVVTLAHLPKQWAREIAAFAPNLRVHVVKKGTPYPLADEGEPGPDVVVLNFHKLDGWADVLAKYCHSLVIDEIQELRHAGSNKYQSAKHLAESVGRVIGLSATPIYNYGGEMFNVLQIVHAGLLGTFGEFYREWCEGADQKVRIRKPVAFGSWLRENHIMLRRTRRDVGRELPPLQRVTQAIDCDTKELDKIEDAAGELARFVLSQGTATGFEKMQAAEQLSSMLRQATGVAKAPHVAAFVRMLLESGESVVLFGWHRAVYEIWKSRLAEFNPAFVTGSESPNQKQQAIANFIDGKTKLLVISLRAGAGIDGLQKRSSMCVFGELDWSPGVHEQCIGRVNRDGQESPVIAYFLLSGEGSDPAMAEVLGLKREQAEGVVNLGASEGLAQVDADHVRRLAESYLGRKRKRKESA